jgi:hypothetical protein
MRTMEPNAETVGSLEQMLGFPPGTFRNPNGRDTRSDKKIETIRLEWRRRLNGLRKRRAKASAPRTLDLFRDFDLPADAA